EILLLAGGTVHAAGAEHVDGAQQSAVFVGIVGRGILDEDDVPTLDQSAELLGGGVDGLLGSEGGVGLTLGLDVGQTQQADLDGLGAGLQSQGRGARACLLSSCSVGLRIWADESPKCVVRRAVGGNRAAAACSTSLVR